MSDKLSSFALLLSRCTLPTLALNFDLEACRLEAVLLCQPSQQVPQAVASGRRGFHHASTDGAHQMHFLLMMELEVGVGIGKKDPMQEPQAGEQVECAVNRAEMYPDALRVQGLVDVFRAQVLWLPVLQKCDYRPASGR
jgi:hypothetical protein